MILAIETTYPPNKTSPKDYRYQGGLDAMKKKYSYVNYRFRLGLLIKEVTKSIINAKSILVTLPWEREWFGWPLPLLFLLTTHNQKLVEPGILSKKLDKMKYLKNTTLNVS